MKKIFTLLAILMATVTTAFAGSTVTVSSLADLQTALANSSVSTVIVSQELSITSNVSLDGQGKTVQVTTPFSDEAGNCLSSGYSTYGVFNVSNSAKLTIKNMTIYGGKVVTRSSDEGYNYGAIYLQAGSLYAENVVVARSCRGIYVLSNGTAVLKNCAIVRNANHNGGGMKIEGGGKAFMDGCSFSENRSLGTTGGGGAVEVNGLFYANNTVIANNCSSEHGGAINICGRDDSHESTVYLMNCTVSGNATVGRSINESYDWNKGSGGGIALRAGRLYAVNTVFMDNYHFISGSSTNFCRSDISRVTPRSGSYDEKLYLYNCVYGAFEGNGGELVSSGCTTLADTDPVFASYRSDGIISMYSSVTPNFTHSVLAHTSAGKFNLYAPAGTTTGTGGVKTYLNYTTDLNTVQMGYGESGSITALGELTAATSDKQVTTYYEGGTRSEGQVGASGYTATQYYTVKLKSGYTSGTVSGATIFGDSYAEGSTVTLTAIPDDGYKLSNWVKEDGTVLSTENPYTFTVNSDVTLYPVFEVGTTELTFNESTATKSDLSAVKGIKANVTIGRTFYKDGGNNTICLPFSLTAAELAASPLAGYTKLQEFSTANIVNKGQQDETLQLTLTNATAIEAGKPYIIAWAKSDNIVNPIFSNVSITADEGTTSEASNGVQFCGTLVPFAMTAGDKSYMFVGQSAQLNWPDVNGNLKGFRCYFTVDQSAGAKIFHGMRAFLVEGNEATGIYSVGSEQSTASRARKLLEQGKVVIISDGKRYTLDGKLIK